MLFRHPPEPVNLVDEKHVAFLQRIRQDRREVAGLLDRRPRGHADAHPEFVGDDVRERRLAQPWRAEEQRVIERLAPAFGRLEVHTELVLELFLADVLGQGLGPQRGVQMGGRVRHAAHITLFTKSGVRGKERL